MIEHPLKIGEHEIATDFLENGELVEAAYKLMILAHSGIYRRIRGEPFYTHPINVARISTDYAEGLPVAELQARGLVHDTIDSGHDVSYTDLKTGLGSTIALATLDLTKRRDISDRAGREELLDIAKNQSDILTQFTLAADHSGNIEDAIKDLDAVGNGFWERFGDKTAESYLGWHTNMLRAIEESRLLEGYKIVGHYAEQLAGLEEKAAELGVRKSIA